MTAVAGIRQGIPAEPDTQLCLPADAVEQVLARRLAVDAVADTAALVRTPTDVYPPCALGRALDDETVAVLEAEIVFGGANNQLAHEGVAAELMRRGILYARLPGERRRRHPGGGRARAAPKSEMSGLTCGDGRHWPR